MVGLIQQSNDDERELEKNMINVKQDESKHLEVNCEIDEDDSSVQSSEIENEETGEWMIDSTVQQMSKTDEIFVLPGNEPSNFGDVCIKNSSKVQLGNKTFYKGPVTIKQFVYANPASPCNKDFINSTDAEKSNVNKISRRWWSWKYTTFICILASILTAGVISISIVLTQKTMRELDVPKIPHPSFLGQVRFIERIEWGAQPPTESIDKINLPVPYVIIAHTATDFCFTQQQCTVHVRFAQMFHIEGRNWSDIGYNFLVGGDGLTYVGRGWDFVGAHSFGFNNVSMGIAFIGTFNTVKPPQNQLNIAQKVIEAGIKLGKIAPNYKLLAHRQAINTLSPGTELFNIIKTWSHWSSTL